MATKRTSGGWRKSIGPGILLAGGADSSLRVPIQGEHVRVMVLKWEGASRKVQIQTLKPGVSYNPPPFFTKKRGVSKTHKQMRIRCSKTGGF